MYIDYSKLWQLLAEKSMTKSDLVALTGISTRVLAKLVKNETVTTETVARICTALSCDVGDMMECVSESTLSVYAAYKKLGTCTEETERYKTVKFKIGTKPYTVYESKQRANRATHIHCEESGDVIWEQLYPVSHIAPARVKTVLIKPVRSTSETVIVLIKGKPSLITGLDENGFVSSRGTPSRPDDVFVMSEAAFKLFSSKSR